MTCHELSLHLVTDLSRKVAEDGVKELGYDEYVPIPSGGAIEMAMMLCNTQGIFTGPLLVVLFCFQITFSTSTFKSGLGHSVFVCMSARIAVDAGISGGASAWAAIEIAKKAPEGSVARRVASN